MKIALLMSGGLGKFSFGNTCDKISEKWTKIIDQYDIDVFCVADDNNYYDEETDTQIFSKGNEEKKTPCMGKWRYHNKIDLYDYEKSYNKINNVIKKYFTDSVKKLKILNFSDLNLDFLKKTNNHEVFYNYVVNNEYCHRNEYVRLSNLSQFYKLKECFNLMCEYEKEQNLKYDMIIRCRFDCILESIYDDSINLNDLDILKTIYSPWSPGHMMDWWAIGNRYIMEKYCKYYDNFAPGIIENYRMFVYHDDKGNFICYDKGYNIKKKNYTICEDISDSNEVGLTYTIVVKEEYNTKTCINMLCDRSYN